MDAFGNSPRPEEEPLRLISAYLDDQIDAAEFGELRSWILEDRDHARLFARMAIIHSGLRSTLQHADLRDFYHASDSADNLELQVNPKNICQMLQEAAETDRHQAEAQALHRAKLLAEELAAEELRQQELERQARRRPEPIEVPRSVAFLALAATVMGVLFFVQSRLGDAPRESRPDMVQVAPPVAHPVTVAMIANSIEASWSSESEPLVPGSRLPVGPVELTEGVVEFAFDDGTRVVGEAPLVMSLLSSNRVRVQRGKLVAAVPEEAIGFTITTTAGSIVDLGTEFGVDVSETGNVGVHVLDGEVALAKRHESEGRGWPVLTTGTARMMAADHDEIREIPYDGTAFLREVPDSPYALAVLQSRPVIFWRLNESAAATKVISRGRLEIASPVGQGVVLNQPTLRPEIGNRAARFSGDHAGIEVGRFPELNLTSNFTIEAWIEPGLIGDQPEPMRFISTFSSVGSSHGGFAMGIAGKGFIGGTTSRQVLLFTLYGVYDCISLTSVQPDQRLHVAAVVDDQGRPTLYLNGSATEAFFRGHKLGHNSFKPLPAEWNPLLRGNESINPCYLGRHPNSPTAEYPPERWQGLIDEVAIFDRQLTDDEIHRHYLFGLRTGESNL